MKAHLYLLLLAGSFFILVECGQDILKELSGNALDPNVAKCGPSGYKCLGNSIYTPCADKSQKRVQFCRKGTICEDSGKEICIPQPPPCSAQGAFLLPGSCNIFYICIRTGSNMKQYTGACEPGYEFSLTTGNCTLPLDAECSVKKVISTDSKTTQLQLRRNDEEAYEKKFVCSSPGLFPDPVSCRHYYMCVKSWFPIFGGSLQVKRMVCPNILPHFNTERKLCWFFNDACAKNELDGKF